MFRVTRRYQFVASHRRATIDTVKYVYGPADPVAGRAVDLPLMDYLVEREILSHLDHRNLNSDVDWFGEEVPTSENLGLAICRRLKGKWSEVFAEAWPRLDRVSIEETARNIFEIDAREVK